MLDSLIQSALSALVGFFVTLALRKLFSKKLRRPKPLMQTLKKQEVPEKRRRIMFEFFIGLFLGIAFLVGAFVSQITPADEFVKSFLQIKLSTLLLFFAFMNFGNVCFFFIAAINLWHFDEHANTTPQEKEE